MKTADHQEAAQPVSSYDLFKPSSALVQAHLNNFALLYLVPFVLDLGSTANSSRVQAGRKFTLFNAGAFSVSSLTGTWGALIAGGVVLLGLIFMINVVLQIYQLRLAQGKKPEMRAVWVEATSLWPRLLGLFIVLTFVITAGLLFLLVPGLIFMRRYFLAPYVMIDQNTTIRESMRRSAELSKPYKRSIWGLLGIMLACNAPSLVPVVGWIGSFVLSMLYSVAPALRYEEFKKLAAQMPAVAVDPTRV